MCFLRTPSNMAVPLRALTIFAHQRRSTLVSVSETGGGINRLLHLLGAFFASLDHGFRGTSTSVRSATLSPSLELHDGCAFKISVLHAYPPHPEGRKDPSVMRGLDTIGDRSCEACLRLQAGQDHQGEPVFVASQRPSAAWGRGRSLFRPS